MPLQTAFSRRLLIIDMGAELLGQNGVFQEGNASQRRVCRRLGPSTCWGDSLPAGLSLWISPFFFCHVSLAEFSFLAYNIKEFLFELQDTHSLLLDLKRDRTHNS